MNKLKFLFQAINLLAVGGVASQTNYTMLTQFMPFILLAGAGGYAVSFSFYSLSFSFSENYPEKIHKTIDTKYSREDFISLFNTK